MSSDVNTDRVVLYIDSKNRTSGTNENFTVTLNSSVGKVKQVELISTEIPFTFYIVNSSNNDIVWNNGATYYRATVTPGSYTANAFTTVLQTAMNSQMAGFTITYQREFYNLKFVNSAAFQLQLTNVQGTSTMSTLIGLSADTALATTVTPQNVINLSGTKYLMIKSQALTKPKIVRPFLNTVQESVLYKISIAGNPGDILVEKNLYTNPLKYGVRQIIKTIDFQLVDDQDQQVDLNGSSWSMTVNLLTG